MKLLTPGMVFADDRQNSPDALSAMSAGNRDRRLAWRRIGRKVERVERGDVDTGASRPDARMTPCDRTPLQSYCSDVG